MRTKGKLDALLAALGLAIGAPSLSWPFGWDTSVHYYVGREWLLRGALPYRDSFDHKPPVIHLVHALTIALFGEGMWGFRVVELACVVALGSMCASLAAGRIGRAPAGLRGGSVLAASLLYYGFFDYWNTAQCELLGTTLVTAMILAATRYRRPAVAALVSGLLAGAAAALKPPFALFAAIAVVVLAWRASSAGVPRRGARVAHTLGTFALGALAVPAAFVAYFAAHHALGALWEVLIGLNVNYVVDEPRIRSVSGVLHTVATMWRYFCPVATVLLASALILPARAALRGSTDRLRRWGLAWALLAIGFAAIAVQMKFFAYHWITALPAVVLAVANTIVDVSLAVRPARRAWAPVVVTAVLVAAYTGTGVQFHSWLRTTAATVHWWAGDWSRARYASMFQTWDGTRRYGDLEAAGLWVRDHSSPGDYVLVRGIAAEIYVVSGRRAPGRFFWTAFLAPWRHYHHDLWVAEDGRVVEEKKARWVVAYGPAENGPDSEAWFRALGYVERARFGKNVILERTDGAPSRNGPPRAAARRPGAG